MKDNGKKYRRSALSIVCYTVVLLMLLYIVYLMGSTASQVTQYYAQYDMKPQPMEYITYTIQAVIEPLINAFLFFMLGYILDEVRKNNPAYYLSDEEIEQAKAAKQEAKLARREERAARKAEAAGAAAAAKAEAVAVKGSSVEEDFVRSLDAELNKDAAKKATRKKSGSTQKKQSEGKQQGEGKQAQTGQSRKSRSTKSEQADKSGKSEAAGMAEQGGDGKKKSEGSKASSGSRKKSTKKPAADKPKTDAAEAPKATITDIDWNKALEMSKAGAVLIDVRTPAEVAEGMAPGAINIPLQEIQQRLSEFPKDKDLLIYCRSGKRSMAASNFLIENGYDKVFNVVGGFLAFPKQ